LSVAYGSIDADRVWTQTALGLYSPRRASHDVTLPYDSTAYPFIESFGAILGSSDLDAFVRGGDLILREVRTDTSEVATFIVEAHLPRPPLSGEATLSAGGELAVSVRNGGDRTLEDAVLIYGQRQYALGDLEPGEEQTANLRLEAAAGSTTAGPQSESIFPTAAVVPNPLANDPGIILGTSDYFNDPVAYPRWQLIQSLYGGETTAPSRLPEATEVVTLGGWLDESAQPVSVTGDNVAQTGLTLTLLEIPVRKNGDH
jgi:hypothetical protein